MPIEQKDPNTGASSFIPTEDEKKQLDLMKKIYSSTVDLDELKNQMKAQELTTQTLQHGANVVNATTPSNLGIEIQGRTLVNLLGQTNLDSSRYYVYVPNKGTTKLTVGGNMYENTFRISGQSAVSYKIKQDFRGKVIGSVVNNGNISKVGFGSSLISPANLSSFPYEVEYERIDTLNGVYKTSNTANNGQFPQNVFSFDIIRTLQDKYGDVIWQGKTALADKINIAKQVVTNIQVNWHGYGSSPTGNKATIKRWLGSTVGWFGTTNHVLGTVTKLSVGITNKEIELGQGIDANGFSHFLAHSEPSNGTVASVINTDYVDVEIETNTNLPLLEDSLYEVDKPTFDKINIDPEYTGQKLLDKLPYVQGVQHLNPVVSAEGDNLAPKTSEPDNINPAINCTFDGINKINATTNVATANLFWYANVMPNTTYTLQLTHNAKIGVFNENASTSLATYTFDQSVTFNSGSNQRVRLYARLDEIGKLYTLENLMLTLGNQPKSFVPRNPSYLYTNTKLAGFNGVNDILYKDNGVWKVLRKWELDIVLDPTKHTTGFYATYSGYKRFGINPQALISSDYMALNDQRFFTTKYDGKILQNNSGYTGADQVALQQPSGGGLKITVANTESGFIDSYTPSIDEISAYFNGWKVKTADGVGKPTAWISVVDGKDAPTQTLVYVKANRAPNYTPYKLTYQLANPRVEIVQVEGDIAVNGLTQVTVDSGVVVREKAKPVQGSTRWQINNTVLQNSFLANRTNNIISVHKNGIVDNSWLITRNNPINGVGGSFAVCDFSTFDTKAEYTVTYMPLDKDKFTTNAVDVKSTYTQSVRSSLDGLNTRQSQSTTDISILQGITVDILARLKANNL